MGRTLAELARLAVRPISIVAMVLLAGFDTGYSLFISRMARVGTPDQAWRFFYLNLLFGVLSTALGAAIILVLSRRLLRHSAPLERPRWVAFVLVAFGLFVLARFIAGLGTLFSVMMGLNQGYWLAARLPIAVMQVMLFPVAVWRVALARGVRKPAFGQIWSQIWHGQLVIVALVLVLAAVGLVSIFAQSWLSRIAPNLPSTAGLLAVTVPDAIDGILLILLAIVSFQAVDRVNSQDMAEVFA